jgi:flagellum-specific peptidoglycan hydrolase FlgJ
MLPISLFTVNTGKVPLKLLAAMASLESNNGNSQLSKQANNYFGIKARKGEPFIILPTKEIVNGKAVTIQAKFAKYDTPADSAKAFINLLQSNRYINSLSKPNLYDQLTSIVNAGYATANPDTYAKAAIAAYKRIGYNIDTKIISGVAGVIFVLLFIFASSKKKG